MSPTYPAVLNYSPKKRRVDEPRFNQPSNTINQGVLEDITKKLVTAYLNSQNIAVEPNNCDMEEDDKSENTNINQIKIENKKQEEEHVLNAYYNCLLVLLYYFIVNKSIDERKCKCSSSINTNTKSFCSFKYNVFSKSKYSFHRTTCSS